jgi:hypothetical protein
LVSLLMQGWFLWMSAMIFFVRLRHSG